MVTYRRVIRNFVWVTAPSVLTVPFTTSRPKSFSDFIYIGRKQGISEYTYKKVRAQFPFPLHAEEKVVKD